MNCQSPSLQTLVSLQGGGFLIFHPKARTVFRLTLAPVIEARGRYVRMLRPPLNLGDIGIAGESVRCRCGPVGNPSLQEWDRLAALSLAFFRRRARSGRSREGAGSDRWIASVGFRSAAAGRLRAAEPSDREIQLNIRNVALNKRVGYVPVYEEIAAKIRALPGRAFTSFRFLPFYRDAFRVIILHKSPDEVSQMNGWNFHTDGVHLNSRAGTIVADLVQAFLDEGTPRKE
jgi:hypothetical protein